MIGQLAGLWVEFKAKGYDALVGQVEKLGGKASQTSVKLDAMRNAIDKASRSTTILGGASGSTFEQVRKLWEKTNALRGHEQIEKTTKAMVNQIAAAKGWSNQQADAYVRLVKFNAGMDTLAGRFSTVSRLASIGFAAGSASLMGFITAGLQGTVMGERLAFQMQQISREIAAIFLPAIQSVANWLQRTARWFRSLTTEQQDNIKSWALWTLGGLGAIAMLPRLWTLLKLIPPALGLISAGLKMAFAHPMVVAIAAIVAAIGGLVYVLHQARDASNELAASMESIEQQGISKQNLEEAGLTDISKMSKEDQAKAVADRIQAEGETIARLHKQINERGALDLATAPASRQEQQKRQMGAASRRLFTLQQAQEQLAKGGALNLGALEGAGAKYDHRGMAMANFSAGALGSTGRRIQEASLKMGLEDIASKQLDVQKQQLAVLEQLKRIQIAAQPLVGN